MMSGSGTERQAGASVAISLRVSSFQSTHLGPNAARTFDAGGSIGRLAKSDWVLPDPDRYISGEHARIEARGNDYFLRDVSSNGTQLNGRALPKGGESRLSSGDVIGIGDYQIAVTIEAPQVAVPASPPPTSPPPAELPAAAMPGSSGTVDPLDLLGGAPSPPAEAPTPGSSPDHAPVDQQFFEPGNLIPDAAPAAEEEQGIPDNWWEEDSAPAQPAPKPTPAAPKPTPAIQETAKHRAPPTPPPEPPAPAATAGSADLDGLFAALGVPPDQVAPGTQATIGGVLKIAVQGLVELLRSRAEFKNQFRVSRTTLKSHDNNPLKTSANAEDALFNLFAKPVPGYLDAEAAFQEGYDDLRAHQVAMMAGMKAGFRAVMQHFDPEQMESRFDRGLKRGKLLDVMNKTKYWELYTEEFARFGSDDDAFRSLFADEFSKAYEQQMQRMLQLRNRGHR